MFFALTSIVFCLSRPIILIPGWGQGELFAEMSVINHPTCGSQNTIKFWPITDAVKLGISYECIRDILYPVFDPEQGTATHSSEFFVRLDAFDNITTYPFGNMRIFLEENGYGTKNLGILYYDWTLYPFNMDSRYELLKEKIIEYHDRSGEKVTLLGSHLGCSVIQTFIQYVGRNWASDHLESCVFISPVFLGNAEALDYLDNGYQNFTDRQLKIALQRMPSVQYMFYNYQAFTDTVIYEGVQYQGETSNVTAPQVFNYLKEMQYFTGDAESIFAIIREKLNTILGEPPCRSLILYNTGIETVTIPFGPFTNGAHTKTVKAVGDGVVSKESAEYACTNWGNVECHDFASLNATYDFSVILHNNDLKQRVLDFVNVEDMEEFNNLKIAMITLVVIAAVAIIAIVVAVILCKRRSG